jgi:hypothetical protein
MSWTSTSLPAVRGRLARYLGQLRHNLDAVGEQMREAVAHAVGKSVAEAVSEAVYDALVSHASTPAPLSPAVRRSTELSTPAGRDWDDMWERPADAALWRDPYPDDDEVPRGDEDRESGDAPSRSREPGTRRWRQALAAGVQAAAWWLRRPRGPVSLRAALTVATVVALAVLAGPFEPVAAVAASALGLASVLELLRAVSNLLAAHVSSAGIRA